MNRQYAIVNVIPSCAVEFSLLCVSLVFHLFSQLIGDRIKRLGKGLLIGENFKDDGKKRC